jgi:translocation and assembly module TamA
MNPILMSMGKLAATLILVLAVASAAADELSYVVVGVGDPLRANVLAHVETFKLGRQARLAESDFPKLIAAAERHAREGLRPFGYYAPEVTGRIARVASESLVLTLEINAGPPIRVADVQLTIVGAGRDIADLRDWRSKWPLRIGAVLDQATWEEEKNRAIDLAQANGFLAAEIRDHALEIDLVNNQARIVLVLDTGAQYVFGDIEFGEHDLKPGVLEAVPRFTGGDRYSRRMLDRFRIDLWQTGYFTNIEIRENERADTEPPQVDLSLTLLTDRKNVYQGSVGVGSDTGVRLQAQWSRHPMSRNGDRLDVGIGWQSQDDEITARANYRLPRLPRNREFWIANAEIRDENLDLEIKQSAEDENFLKIADGNIADYHLRVGNLRIRNFKQGDRQWFGTAFVQYLNSIQSFEPRVDIPELQPDSANLLKFNDDVISIGYEADIVDVWGKGFDAGGSRDRLYFFVSEKALGSDSNFKQAYIGTRRVYRRGDRWKLLVRGEVGYTDALVDNLTITVPTPEEPGGIPVALSVTQLPNFYRFKAGGSQSVRGYAFESLSNNDIGSNHIVTASIETEFRFLENWSAAAFFDIGNAFNDWDDPNLRKGVGVGIRWYSIAGPIRVDVAQALDFEGRPWRIHFTIGTPLL